MPEVVSEVEPRAVGARAPSAAPGSAGWVRGVRLVGRDPVRFVLALVLAAFLLRAVAAVAVEQISFAAG